MSNGSVEQHTLETWTLEIAQIPVILESNDLTILSRLQERYAAFPASQPGVWRLHIAVIGAEQTMAYMQAQPQFNGPITRLEGPGFAGMIDETEAYAELTLSSSRPIEEIDYFLRVLYAVLAFRAGGFLFHTAGIMRGGAAYLFFGHSGSGKTTVSRNSSTDIVLNDDLIIVLPAQTGWMAYGTPFWNPTQVPPVNRYAPIRALLRLVQAPTVLLEAMGMGQALAELVSSTPVLMADPQRSRALFERGRALLSAVPAYRLHLLPDPSFWDVVDTIG